MGLASKILWSEGLALGPQQFQQQDRYHEMRLQRLAAALNVHVWGVRAIGWDAASLEHQLLCADVMALLFQDGELIEAPATHALPAPFDLSRLAPELQRVTIYAALPCLQPHGGNLAPAARYACHQADTPDLFSEAASAEVSYLRGGVTLLAEDEPRDGYLSFPVAHLRRLPTGSFEFDPAFMPPAVSVAACGPLAQLLERLLAKLGARIEALQARQRQSSGQLFEVHSGEIAAFWMLHTLCGGAASLLHCARARHQHPELVFDKLMGLAGALMSFSSQASLADLPLYRHEDPGPAFQQIDALIGQLVDTMMAARYSSIALVADPQRPTHYRGQLDAARVGPQTELCLAVCADLPPLELVAAVPLLFKVASPDDLERIVASALHGAELMHLAQVPSALPVRPNIYYFAIGSRGALYQNMLAAQAVAIYVPAAMKALKLELLAME